MSKSLFRLPSPSNGLFVPSPCPAKIHTLTRLTYSNFTFAASRTKVGEHLHSVGNADFVVDPFPFPDFSPKGGR